jgi:hypothetical protein
MQGVISVQRVGLTIYGAATVDVQPSCTSFMGQLGTLHTLVNSLGRDLEPKPRLILSLFQQGPVIPFAPGGETGLVERGVAHWGVFADRERA